MLSGRHIALVEDDEIMGASIHQRLKLEGAEVTWVKTFHRALGALRTPRRPFDAVVCDIRLPDGSGEDLFARLCEHGAPPPFLFMTGQAGVDQAVRLLRSGAADYLVKPFDMGRFLERLAHLVAPEVAGGAGAWLGVSPAARRAEAAVTRLAAAEGPVLILGESGGGKRLAAQRLHALSDRRAAPFAAVDFTRADDAMDALFGVGGALARVRDGVLLLERIGAAPAAVQTRLLAEALRRDEAAPRLVATEGSTPDDLAPLRPDLRHQLGALSVTLPPLHARPEDAVWLLARLFEGMNARRTPPLRGISAPAEAAVRAHGWPGGGRELRSRLARAMAMAEGEWIFPADLFPEGGAATEATAAAEFGSLADAREAAERAQIRRALERADGNMTEAARLLKVARTTLWEKMQKLGM